MGLLIILLGLVWASGVLGQTIEGFPKVIYTDPYWVQVAIEDWWHHWENPGEINFENYWGQIDSCGINLDATWGDELSLNNSFGVKILNQNLFQVVDDNFPWTDPYALKPNTASVFLFADGLRNLYDVPGTTFTSPPATGEQYEDPPLSGHYVYRALVDQDTAGPLLEGTFDQCDQFRYRPYYVTFRMKMVGDNLEHIKVAEAKLWCTRASALEDDPHSQLLYSEPDTGVTQTELVTIPIYADDFQSPGSYEDITLSNRVILQNSAYKTHLVLDWLDERDLYVDNVLVRDIYYYYTFEYNGGGQYDQVIKDSLHAAFDINPNANFRWYKDEPRPNMLKSFRYVDSLAREAGTVSLNCYYPSSNGNAYVNFIEQLQPQEFITGYYPIWANTDSSSSSEDPYSRTIQDAWDEMISLKMRKAILAANGDPGDLDDDIPFWMTIQTCDYWYKGHQWRHPTANEIKAEIYLSLCYGAKGIMYFVYPTIDTRKYQGSYYGAKFGGLVDLVDANGQPTSDPTIGHFVPNYKWYVVRDMNAVLDSLNPVIQGLTWVDAGKWDEVSSLTGSYITSVTSDRFPQDSVWVEVGLFHDDLYDYFMLVNRRCLSTETQQVTVELSKSGLWAIKDMYSGEESWLTSSEGVMSFSTTLGPGEGKLFRLREGFSGPVLTDQAWEGLIGISGDITVPDSVTLTINPGTALKFAPGGDNQAGGVDTARCELIVEGSLSVQGTKSQPVSFSSFSSNQGDWWGIRFKEGSWGELRHTVVEYGYCGILADSGSTVTIDSCTIQKNEVYGIRCEHTDGATTISGNRIWNNGVYGVWTEHCSPDILDNLINGSRYGIKASYAGSDMLIKGNSIDNASIQPKDQPPYDNYVGISLQNSSPLILDNEIGGGKGLSGLSCSSGSNPEVRSCIIDARCKKGISCYDGSSPTVDSTQVHSYTERGIYCYQSSYPRLGDTGIEGSGGNSISSRDGGYEVWCEENLQPVMAESCWWGMAIPDPSRFHGAVDWLPCLDHDPFGEVGVEDGPKEGLPTRFTLFQNYPNPFNPTTLIRYSLLVDRQGESGDGGSRARTTSTSYVSLKVYNVLGELMETLVDERQRAGSYRVRWDASKVASGIYFCTLKAGGYRQTIKMVVMK